MKVLIYGPAKIGKTRLANLLRKADPSIEVEEQVEVKRKGGLPRPFGSTKRWAEADMVIHIEKGR